MTTLLFTNETLQNYGCINCIWKEMGQCPYNLQGSESLPIGYCDKLFDFLTHLAEGEDSISAVKEKFHLFIQETQSLSDRSEYFKLKKEYDSLILAGENPNSSEMRSLEVRMNNSRLCWNRMSDTVIKGLSRVVDRERRSSVDSVGARLTVQELNTLLKSSIIPLQDVIPLQLEDSFRPIKKDEGDPQDE